MELKWALAMGLEAAFWTMLVAFLILRYRYEVEGVTRLFVIGVVLDTAGIVALGAWDFATTGAVSTYTIFIAALIVYSLTSGREHFERLDASMSRRIKSKRRAGVQAPRGRPCPDCP